MASLPKSAQDTSNVEDQEFAPMPVGVYHARLMDVDTSKSGPKGPYWSFQYDIVTPGFENRKLWDNVSLSDSAAFKRKQVWEAFGVDLDTDTDDMCGSIVKLQVAHRTIQSGAREGEIAEQIARTAPADPAFAEMATVKGATGRPAVQSAEDLF